MLLGLIHPLASLLATVETGPGKNVKAPCGDLVQSLQANVQGAPATKEKAGTAAVSKGERQRLSERQEPATQKEVPGEPVTMSKDKAAASKDKRERSTPEGQRLSERQEPVTRREAGAPSRPREGG